MCKEAIPILEKFNGVKFPLPAVSTYTQYVYFNSVGDF